MEVLGGVRTGPKTRWIGVFARKVNANLEAVLLN